MKRYHPQGRAISIEQDTTAFLLSDNDGIAKPRIPSRAGILVVSPVDFEQLVKQNQVQLFQWNGQEIINAYTEEETKAFKMAARRTVRITTENYFKGENTVADSFIHVEGSINIGVVMCRVFAMQKLLMFTGAVYLRGASTSDLEFIKKHSLIMSPVAADMVICNWTAQHLVDIIHHFGRVGRPVSCCTLPMSYLDNPLYAVKMMGFRPASEVEIREGRDLLKEAVERYCTYTEPATGIGKSEGVSQLSLK